MQADPSSFFRINEEIAGELARLERSGVLDRLLDLLAAGDVTLRVASLRERDGLDELLGQLSPRLDGAAPEVPAELGPGSAEPRPAGCGGCGGAADVERVRGVAAELERPRGGWDHEGFMTARSRFVVALPGGEPREIYAPDHACPSCWNAEGNRLSSCARACVRCGFEW